MSNLDISYLIAPRTAADFFADYWQKSALLIKRAEPDRFQSLIPATDVWGMLSLVEQFPFDALDLVGSARTIHHAPESSGLLADFFTKGSTIRAKGLERFLSTLKALCRNIEQELRFPTRANLYCTPAASRGFDLHFDTHDVLVLQLLGKKRWQAYEPNEPMVKLPLEHLPPLAFETDPEMVRRSRGGREMGQNITREELGPVAIDAILEPGDCLYLPRGFVHGAESLDEPSVHLTIGIHVLTWLDLFSVALGQSAYQHEALREALPVGSLADPETRKDLGREFAERIQLFSQDPDVEAAVDALTASFDRNFDATPVTSSSLDQQTKLTGMGQLQLYLSADGAMAGLALGQNIFWMPECFAPVMRFIVEHQSFSPHELPGQITDNGKLSFLRRLVDDGFVRLVD